MKPKKVRECCHPSKQFCINDLSDLNLTQRSGVQMDDIIKKRSLNLAQSLTPQQEQKLVTEFSEIIGVRRFEIKGHSGLKIT